MLNLGARRFSRIARRKPSHQAKTARNDETSEAARHLHATAVVRGRGANRAREQRRKAAEAREADLHADLGHRRARGEQQLGASQACLRANLVRGAAIHRSKLPNEVKRRQADLNRNRPNRERIRSFRNQELPRPHQSTKCTRSDQQGVSVTCRIPGGTWTKNVSQCARHRYETFVGRPVRRLDRSDGQRVPRTYWAPT